MKIVALNGGPRKNWNTGKLLEQAVAGAEAAGAEVEQYHLYDYNYKGCYSCFACKRRHSQSVGLCTFPDGATPIIKSIAESDGLLIATPVYLRTIPGELHSFLERLVYMCISYDKGERTQFKGKLHFAFIYTMSQTPRVAETYKPLFDTWMHWMSYLNGEGEYMIEAHTTQFEDYSLFLASAIDEEKKEKYRAEHFPVACENAYNLGARLARR